MFKDQYRAVMQYSLPRDGRPGEPPRILHDWICSNCGVQNFRRRDQCFKCGGPKTDIDASGEGADEVSPHPTNTVLLRNLDILSTEDSVLNCLGQVTKLPIKSLKIGRDSLTNTSRGVCYVEMNTVVDAMFLHNQLLGEPPTIDEKLVAVSYYRPPIVNSSHGNTSSDRGGQPTAAANAALAAAQWSHQGRQGHQGQYSPDEIEKMAEYSANLYAKNESEKAHYLEYYRNYYKNGGDPNAGQQNPQKNGNNSKKEDSHGKVIVDGVEYKIYPTPDVSTYTYDEGSGYYYDSVTQYYYDAKTQYYYNSQTKQYVYWEPEHRTYLPAPAESGKTGSEAGDKKPKEDKKDKVKTAKRIAKDMEKWAKTLNQKKDAAKQSSSTYSVPPQQPPDVQIQKQNTEDLAFNMVLSKKEETSGSGLASLTGYGSADEPEEEVAAMNAVDEQQITDWSQLACLLCKRAFPSKEKLIKHNQVSDLHKNNMEAWHREHKPQSGREHRPQSGASNLGGGYRDRAQERRQKYGIDDEGPRPNRLKEKYLQAVEVAELSSNNSSSSSSNKGRPKPLDESNLGSKMLQKMGWKEGLGLGKANQGRTSIIEAEARNSQAGLGSKNSAKSNPNESYKDSVKRTLFSRYHDMD
jgi:RNA-binding protein 5/10